MKIIYSLGLFSFLILASCQKEEITVSGVYELDDGFTVSFDQGAFKIKVAEWGGTKFLLSKLGRGRGSAYPYRVW